MIASQALRDDGPAQAVYRVIVPPLGLEGLLRLPEGAIGVVAFAHGSGSSRFSPRNNFVADTLARAGIATLLFDLLSEVEASERRLVFDIPLLADRLQQAVDWLRQDPRTRALKIGLFGASTGAAAALTAAAELGSGIAAVVSRGGRPDLAGVALTRVMAPTLLIVGSLDTEVLVLNRQARARMHCPCALKVVAGASHLFEEPGTLATAATLASDWFGAQFRS